MLKTLLAVGIAIVLTSTTATAQAPPMRRLQVTFDAAGTVNVIAQGVTVRDILAEWARQCGCYVVNAEKLTGAALPVPVQFDHADQAVVLASLLRQASGYVLTPQRVGARGPSRFETIYLLPPNTAPPASASTSPYATPGTSVPIQAITQVPLNAVTAGVPSSGSPDDELAPVPVIREIPMPGQNPNAPPRVTTISPFVPATPVTTPIGAQPGIQPGMPVPAQPGMPTAPPRPGGATPGPAPITPAR